MATVAVSLNSRTASLMDADVSHMNLLPTINKFLTVSGILLKYITFDFVRNLGR